MKRTTISLLMTACLLMGLTQTVGSAVNETAPVPIVKELQKPAPKRVLFIGNSYLYYNDSVHNHVRRMAEERGPYSTEEYQYKSATIGGSRLSHHPIDGLLEPGRLGIDQPFELVVLQGGSGEVLTEASRAQFRLSAMQMSEKIRATGAQVALYMTHAYVPPDKRYEPNLIDKILPMYVSVGNELGALVIPVGLAFEKAYQKRPDIVLHKTFDGTHPSLLGTYLAACVVYQSIYGNSTLDIGYDYFGAVSKEDAAFLSAIADETVREFFGR